MDVFIFVYMYEYMLALPMLVMVAGIVTVVNLLLA